MAKKMHIPMWKRIGLPTPIFITVNGKRKCPYRVYRIWLHIKERANCPPYYRRTRDYKYYAHVTICVEWRKFEPFYFWSMEHGYKDDRSIDRIDGSKGYTPDNCRWATPSEQNKNRRMTKAWREACRRNLAKGRAALKAIRKARKARGPVDAAT